MLLKDVRKKVKERNVPIEFFQKWLKKNKRHLINTEKALAINPHDIRIPKGKEHIKELKNNIKICETMIKELEGMYE
ncbi:MAG: hypothetical protein WC783_04360 [Candidatus Paceibacterota bacterium]|jgi:hypothetical protein